MLSRLSLRLRVFLIFAGLAVGLNAVIGAALLVAWRRLDQAGHAPEAPAALLTAAAIGVFGSLALVVWVWFLFDQNVARPIETLAGGLRTGAAPDTSEGRYLADLAPAAREAAEARARSAEALAEAIQTHVDELGRDKVMLESVLSDIGAVALMIDAEGRVVFFNAAGGDPAALMGPLGRTLMAVSLGAVFMGANSYIGNAPNFMVKSIAESGGVKMPSFFGYMIWSIGILIPCFLLVTWIFFR